VFDGTVASGIRALLRFVQHPDPLGFGKNAGELSVELLTAIRIS
jgi:hypothetical protein